MTAPRFALRPLLALLAATPLWTAQAADETTVATVIADAEPAPTVAAAPVTELPATRPVVGSPVPRTTVGVPTPATPVIVTPAGATVLARPQPAAEAATRAGSEPRFDLSVSNAPAAQVFLQLAQGSTYNMLVSPELGGTLSVTLKDTTVPEAMDTLRELFGYEYRITGNRIFVYPNTVQTRLFRINYLPGRRQGSSDLRVSAGNLSSNSSNGSSSSGTTPTTGGSSGSSSGSSGSGRDNAEVRTTSDADFWREVQASLLTMVGTIGGRSVVLNPAAGVIVVRASPAELRQVENYLKAVQLSIERQVMLEAKIVEVQLSKDTQTGINWAGFGKILGDRVSTTIGVAAPGTVLATTGALTSADGTQGIPGVNLAANAASRGFYGLALQASNFAALLNFLQSQGDVQVLSSPRIATLNNQKAVLKVGSDELYLTNVSTTTTSSASGSVSTPTLSLQPMFSGISLDVTPQIDDAGNVMLHIHPTISTVSEKAKNIDLGALGSYKLPLAAAAVNETDSIVRVRDGQIVAIGGLMKVELRNDRSGVTGLADLPVFGNLFRQTSDVKSKSELVIMLKPTIIDDEGHWPAANVPQVATTVGMKDER